MFGVKQAWKRGDSLLPKYFNVCLFCFSIPDLELNIYINRLEIKLNSLS